ncbi:MAG TPA: ABC transporter permease, partial [Bryobacteraceae bacterium]|nr:ABC transporter permease [Bryobacteraceae bacterium]
QFAARRALGNTARIAEEVREAWGWGWLDRSKQDLAYAARGFARRPGFTAVVILILALGIGATTAMFSVVNAVLLHPLPFRDPERLVVIWEKLARNPKNPPVFDTYHDFENWKSGSRSFAWLTPATWKADGQILTGAGPARDVFAMPVGIDFFSMLGIAPELGRTFQREDLRQTCTVVLKHSFWMETFGGQGSVIGRHIELNQNACTIVGVMPPGFAFYPDAAALWSLITPTSALARDPNSPVGVFGLLKPGVSIEQAQQEVTALYRNSPRKDVAGVPITPAIYPLAEQFAYLTGPTLRLTVMVLFGAVIFVLLIGCLNIANLLLGKSASRRKELAVRAALGSGRARLTRQLLTEALLLSVAGGGVGILLALGAVHLFQVLHPVAMPPGNPVSVNPRVLGFTAPLAVITALVFGLIPALKASRVDLMDALRASGQAASAGRTARTFRRLLVIAEVALSLALLAGAGLLTRSVERLAGVPLGFRTDGVFTMPVTLPKWAYASSGQRARFYRAALDRTAQIPDVASAAFASSLPPDGRFGGRALKVEGRPAPPPATTAFDVGQVSISPEYFRLLGVPLKLGRAFDGRDGEQSPPVAIVNDALVRRYFPHENPIGRRIQVPERGAQPPWLTIVGVAANEKGQDFFHPMNWEESPAIYRPVSQDPPPRIYLVFRTRAAGSAAAAAIQKGIGALDRDAPLGDVETMDERLSRALAYPRLRAAVLAAFAGFALLLAALGLYAVLSQWIAQRTQEFGVRMALGAGRSDLLRLVIGEGMALTAAGLAAGLAIALLLTGLLNSLLYGVKATDPVTLAVVSLLLVLVALAATYIPARRAARVDPITALRYE